MSIEPSYFEKNNDSNIYRIVLKDIVTVTSIKGRKHQEITTKGIADYNQGNLWFLVNIYNDGKNENGTFIRSGYYIKMYNRHLLATSAPYTWEEHFYVIHHSFEYYHYIGYETKIMRGYNLHLPTLGPKNKIKIRTNIRQTLSKIYHNEL